MELRNYNSKTTEEESRDINFYRETPIFLVDHSMFNKFNSDVVSVNHGERKFIFIQKEPLVKELEKHNVFEVA